MIRCCVLVASCCIVSTQADAQVATRADTGARVRLDVATEIRRSPVSLPGTRVMGTIRGISPETVYVRSEPTQDLVAIPRILVQRVERSLGPPSRVASMKELAAFGATLGVILPFEDGWMRVRLLGAGAGLGALVGLLRPYERWEPAWIPVAPGFR